MQRKVRRHRLELPRPDRPAPVPPRLDEHPLWYAAAAGLWKWIAKGEEMLTVPVRCRPFQGGSWPGLDRQAPHRDHLPRLRPPPEGTPTTAHGSRHHLTHALTLRPVFAKLVPVQAAQEGRPGSYVVPESTQARRREMLTPASQAWRLSSRGIRYLRTTS